MLPVPDFKTKKKESYNLIGKVKVKLLVGIGFVVLALFFAQMVFANKLATDGQKLSQTEEEIKKLEEINSTLKINIAKESSIVSISKKAESLGFEKPSTVIIPQYLLD